MKRVGKGDDEGGGDEGGARKEMTKGDASDGRVSALVYLCA